MKHFSIQRRTEESSRAIATFSFLAATVFSLPSKALAHGGHDHSKREAPSSVEGKPSDQPPSPLSETQPQPSTESVPTTNAPSLSSTDAEGNQAVQMVPSEPNTALFNAGEVGTGELLFVLIIAIPFLLKVLRHRLHSSRA